MQHKSHNCELLYVVLFQTIPRVVTYDAKTGTNILQWPVKEVESLRTDSREYDNLLLQPGSIINLDITSGAQVCISSYTTLITCIFNSKQ